MSSQPAIRQIAHGTKETEVPPQMLFLPCSPVPTFALFFFIAEAFIYDFSLSATGMQSLSSFLDHCFPYAWIDTCTQLACNRCIYLSLIFITNVF